MSDFGDEIRSEAQLLLAENRAVFVGTVMAAHESITIGSPITGSPGQPVDEGGLRASWTADIQGDVGIIGTNLEYAESNEDGIARPGGGPYIQRSAVGGRHSVSKTIDGFPRLVEHVKRQVAGES